MSSRVEAIAREFLNPNPALVSSTPTYNRFRFNHTTKTEPLEIAKQTVQLATEVSIFSKPGYGQVNII
jgi:hypothetical protein